MSHIHEVEGPVFHCECHKVSRANSGCCAIHDGGVGIVADADDEGCSTACDEIGDICAPIGEASAKGTHGVAQLPLFCGGWVRLVFSPFVGTCLSRILGLYTRGFHRLTKNIECFLYFGKNVSLPQPTPRHPCIGSDMVLVMM